MNAKTLRKSPIVIALYVLAGLTLIYTAVQAVGAIKYVVSYYSQYSMTPEFGQTVSYVLQTAFQPLVMAVLLGAAGYILNEVRALNPAYYATKEELEAIKAAKKAAKAAKKAENTDEAKLEVSVEDAEAEPTVVFESVEAVDATPTEEALKSAEENL